MDKMKAKLIKKTTGIYKIECDGKLIASTDDDMNKHLEISKLSLKNCEAIERGYDLSDLLDIRAEILNSYLDGTKWQDDIDKLLTKYREVIESMCDKKFSEEDVKLAIDMSKDIKYVTYSRDEIIQSLQQTEWDVTFNPDEKDSEGCLILKHV